VRKAIASGYIRNWVRNGVGVGEEEPTSNYSMVVLFEVMQGHRSSCWMPSHGDGCE